MTGLSWRRFLRSLVIERFWGSWCMVVCCKRARLFDSIKGQYYVKMCFLLIEDKDSYGIYDVMTKEEFRGQ